MDEVELAFAGIARQSQLLRAREVSSRELVELYIGRIERLDPQLNAFRSVYAEQALSAADAADARLGAGEEAPLLGVPIAIKDDTDVEGDITSHGSAGHGPPATADSEIVRRLREAGAIPIGHTKVPELELWPFTESEAWGITRNPWNPTRTPGGSSGGSAAAVAAGLTGAATAADGMGSIRIPAASCGIFGVKPQRGRISTAPQREPWHGLSVLGPLARRVADAALFLDVTADPAGPPLPQTSFTAAAAAPPDRLRVAVSREVPPGVVTRIDPQVLAAIDELAGILRSLGHDVHDAKVSYGTSLPHTVLRYLRGAHDAAQLMAHPGRFERRSQGFVRLGGLVPARVLAASRARENAIQRRVWRIFDDFDVILAPILTKPVAAADVCRGKGTARTLEWAARYTPYGVWNLLGNPCTAIPVGFDDGGTPIGLQLVGRPNDEATLLSLSAQLEAELGWPERKPSLAA